MFVLPPPPTPRTVWRRTGPWWGFRSLPVRPAIVEERKKKKEESRAPRGCGVGQSYPRRVTGARRGRRIIRVPLRFGCVEVGTFDRGPRRNEPRISRTVDRFGLIARKMTGSPHSSPQGSARPAVGLHGTPARATPHAALVPSRPADHAYEAVGEPGKIPVRPRAARRPDASMKPFPVNSNSGKAASRPCVRTSCAGNTRRVPADRRCGVSRLNERGAAIPDDGPKQRSRERVWSRRRTRASASGGGLAAEGQKSNPPGASRNPVGFELGHGGRAARSAERRADQVNRRAGCTCGIPGDRRDARRSGGAIGHPPELVVHDDLVGRADNHQLAKLGGRRKGDLG